MDEELVAKTYKTILYTWAVAMVWALAYQKVLLATNITIGVAVGTASLLSIDIIVRRVFVPNAGKPKLKLIVFALAKYISIAIMLYWLVRWKHANLIAFCGGIVLVHFALLAKLAGIKIVEQRARHGVAASTSADRSKES